MVATKSVLSAVALAGVAAAETIDVMVGQGGLKFVPDNIKAKAGDEVVFHFVMGHHDVTLGRYDSPCMPIQGESIWSGVVDTVEKGKGVTFTVPIHDDKTKWIYCSVAKHCQNGMSLVINEPSSGDNQADYKDRAKIVPQSGSPTQVKGGTLGGSGGSGGSSSSSASSSGSSSGVTSAPTPTGGHSSSHPSSTSGSDSSNTQSTPDATLIPSGSIPSATGSGSHSSTPTASPGAAAGLKGSAVLAGMVALGAWIGLL
ncbi:extracellular serine-rich protein [Trichophyton verrucosum HKI 0517]|uniref:Extracellular serine-rich protein n=1 Tax=Trichophyton verrucosum (strain HKI 0517) TaxID=663202 RepID=D4DCS6_TRIVH|nr:extracellular serine-rich protein [Trichophyton verrucosum HKI 0517]EFE40352.1 extracellular serine-rich protein [Trichophyton verrucosum HKI 0517]